MEEGNEGKYGLGVVVLVRSSRTWSCRTRYGLHNGMLPETKTSNQMWDNTKEQEKRNTIDTMSNDKIFNKLTLGIGDDVRVLENKGKFDKGNAQFSQEIYEIHDRIGYSYKVKDTEGSVKRRRYKSHELLVVDNVTSCRIVYVIHTF